MTRTVPMPRLSRAARLQRFAVLVLCAALIAGCAKQPGTTVVPTNTEYAKNYLAAGKPYEAYQRASFSMSGSDRDDAIAFARANPSIWPAVKSAMDERIRAQPDYAGTALERDLQLARAAGIAPATDLAAFDRLISGAKLATSRTVADHEKRLAAYKPTRVYLVAEPDNRLVVEDVKRTLGDMHSVLQFVDAPEKGAVTIRIKQLRWSERQVPERSRVITVGYYQTDLATALFELPKNASTLIDVLEGGAELDFAFELVATENGKPAGSQLVRDRVRSEYHQCAGMRVQNVFGGTTNATSYPNAQSKAFCESGTPPTAASDLAPNAWRAIGDAIRALPPITAARNRHRQEVG
jgi:hypothetical protein